MKNKSRCSALLLLSGFMASGIKPVSCKNPEERPYSEKEKQDMKAQMELLKRRIDGESLSRSKKVKPTTKEAPEDEWEIQIYSVRMGYASKAAKKKAKNKKKTGMKRVKSMTLIQTVKNRDGLITAYKAGTMGISPKNHVFKMVKKSENLYE
jgi:hypothetical protein